LADSNNNTGSLLANPYVLLVIAPLFWGGNAVAGKLATVDWLPFTITALRWACATVLLLPFALRPLLRDKTKLKDNAVLLLGLGAIGMAMFNLLMYLALTYTTAVNVSIIQAIMPVFIIAANFAYFRQRVGLLQSIGLALSILGVMVTTTGGNPLSFFSGSLNRGDAIMLLASAFYAAYTFGLRWRPDIHWLSFMWMIALGATLGTTPFALWEIATQGFSLPITPTAWWVLLYVTLFPTVVSQLAYARGVSLIGSNRAGLFINLVPIFGSLLAIIVLGEIFGWYHALGLVMVIGGIMLAEYFAEPAVLD
jgi:drug/metabolite transporter (DMT)-like permease